MDKKYIFTGLTKVVGGLVLHQIKRIADGVIGGWLEKEQNLSQFGDAWVSGDARVSGNAQVYGDAQVYGNTLVSGNARVSGNAQVYGDAQVYGNTWVSGNARVSGNTLVSGNARVSGNAWVSGNARVEKPYQALNLINLSYSITVTPQNAVIGCQLKTHKAWLKVTRKEAVLMGLPANQYSTFKRLLTILIKEVTK